MRPDKIKIQEELIAKALAKSSQKIANANRRGNYYYSIKKKENKKACALEWTRENCSLRKKISSLESQVEAWLQNERSEKKLRLELDVDTKKDVREEIVDPIILEEEIVDIRNRYLLRNEKVSPPFTTMHSLELLRQDLSSVLNINSSLKSYFEEQSMYIIQKSEIANRESMHITKKRLQDLSFHIVNFFTKDISTAIENQIKEESTFRSFIITLLKSIMEKSAIDEIEYKQLISKNEQNESELIRRIERLETGQKIQNYHHQKKIETEEALRAKQAYEESERKTRTEEMVEAKQRVEHRNVLLELRKKQQKQEAERDRLNEELKVSKLKRLTALVPYYETITNAKSDIHKLTKARIHDVYQYSSKCDLLAFQQGDKKMTCFKEEKIFSDPKFRLAQQLHDKGIASSKYSLAVVKSLIPRETERTTGIEPY